VALSFGLAAPVNTARYSIYSRVADRHQGLERFPTHVDDAILKPRGADILVFGMGRVGIGAYDEFVLRRGDVVTGVDRDERSVDGNLGAGRRMIRGDALDIEFWSRLQFDQHVDLVVLTMNDHAANMETVRRVKEFLPNARIAAIAFYPDEVLELEAAGVDVARNLFGEAGQGVADDACDVLYNNGTWQRP